MKRLFIPEKEESYLHIYVESYRYDKVHYEFIKITFLTTLDDVLVTYNNKF